MAKKSTKKAPKSKKSAKYTERETWLQAGVAALAPIFKKAGYELPPVKVSCSWPGGGSARKALGECWARKNSAAKINEIFISPRIADPVQALDVLAHELCHAVDDCASGHKKPFEKIARAIGLEGKLTATVAGETLRAQLVEIVKKIGAYPHATLSLADRKKQTTRMIKVECKDCGGVFRTTQKWIDEAEHDLCCPFCHSESVTVAGQEKDSDEDEGEE